MLMLALCACAEKGDEGAARGAQAVQWDIIPTKEDPSEAASESSLSLFAEQGEAAVLFADGALEECVREALGKPEGDLLLSELAGITALHITGVAAVEYNPADIYKNDIFQYGYRDGRGALHRERGDIRHLSDLAHMPNLTVLSVSFQKSLSLEGLNEAAPNLKSLRLSYNDLDGLSELSAMTQLTE